MVKTYKKTSTQKLAKNFTVKEFACKGNDCTTVKVDTKLVDHLQKIRDHFNKKVFITSGYRCSSHNSRVGGTKNSYHTKGMAVDIVVDTVSPKEVAKYCETIGILGIGLYETPADGYFVHIDTREYKSFWYGQKQIYRSTFGGKKLYSGVLPTLPSKGYICYGDTGVQVKRLQEYLNWYGDYNLVVDGIFGNKTDIALRDFQQKTGLIVDAKCGKNTLAKFKVIKK